MTDDKITLKINGQPIHFNVSTDAHERVIDEMKADSKVGPMNNFLVRTVDEKSKDKLAPFLKNPSSTMEIGTKLVEKLSPKLKITVGE